MQNVTFVAFHRQARRHMETLGPHRPATEDQLGTAHFIVAGMLEIIQFDESGHHYNYDHR